MYSFRRTAVIVGVLYIIASAGGVVSGILLGPLLDDSDYLSRFAENENQIIAGAMFYFIMAAAIAAIPIVIYPVLKKHDEVLALGYVGARIVEGALFLASIIIVLTLFSVSQDFVEAGSPNASHFQTLGASLIAVYDWTSVVFAGLIFCMSALILNYVLYQSRLVPRWLSSWGLIGAVIYPVAVTSLVGATNSTYFYAPLALQEMVFAVWLIVKGFNSAAIGELSGKNSNGTDDRDSSPGR